MVVKCQTSVVPPIPCQEFLNMIPYHWKGQCVKRCAFSIKLLQELRSSAPGLHHLSAENVFPHLSSDLPRHVFLNYPLFYHLSWEVGLCCHYNFPSGKGMQCRPLLILHSLLLNHHLFIRANRPGHAWDQTGTFFALPAKSTLLAHVHLEDSLVLVGFVVVCVLFVWLFFFLPFPL